MQTTAAKRIQLLTSNTNTDYSYDFAIVIPVLFESFLPGNLRLKIMLCPEIGSSTLRFIGDTRQPL